MDNFNFLCIYGCNYMQVYVKTKLILEATFAINVINELKNWPIAYRGKNPIMKH